MCRARGLQASGLLPKLRPRAAAQIDVEAGFGAKKVWDLAPDGASVAVDSRNVGRYVDAYAHALLSQRVSRQFRAFRQGFRQCCDGDFFRSFRPGALHAGLCSTWQLPALPVAPRCHMLPLTAAGCI